jgi:hypothetical protein
MGSENPCVVATERAMDAMPNVGHGSTVSASRDPCLIAPDAVLPRFTQTEPELLIGAMERHADWAVVVCLVGGGQEINTGEAGISAWLDGVRTLFPGWDVFISPHLTDSEYAASGALERLSGCGPAPRGPRSTPPSTSPPRCVPSARNTSPAS